MKSPIKTLLITLLLINLGMLAHAAHRQELKVGIFQMPPLNFTDGEGFEKGLYPDLLREVVREQNWHLIFVPGSWGQCYDRLMNGEIDLITTVAYSEERAKVFDYNKEAVADIWGKVYKRSDSNISNLNDLSGKSVAIARRDINGKNFLQTAQRLGVEPNIVEAESHNEIFSLVSSGKVDAGVVPQHFGFREAKQHALVPTTIEFEPFSVYFAVKKGANSNVLEHIDRHLSKWKQDPESFYYKRVAYWMTGVDLDREVIPRWVYFSLLAVLGCVLVLALVSASLKRQVRLRTKELADREARFRRLSETTKAVPWELDLVTSRFNYVAPRIVDMLGYPREEWTDMESWAAKVHPDDRKWALDFCALETMKGQDHDFVYRSIHKEGHEVWIHDLVTVSSGPKGPEKLYGYFVDVTEIREHEQRFQKMFQEHNAVMLLIDPESASFVDANTAACQFFGYSHEELTSMPLTRLNDLPEREIRKIISQAIQKKQNYFELTQRLASGESKFVEAYAYPVVINAKPILFAIVHDITERKRLFAEHGRTEQLAALGTVAAGVAHEINNPIQGIMNYAALLQKNPENSERVLDIAQRIAKESDRIAKITKDLLHYSKDRRDEMKSVNINALVQSALSLIVPKVRPSGVQVETDFSAEANELVVNPQSIQQVVINLVDNAYDALKVKDINRVDKIISVRTFIKDVEGRSRLCIEVRDNGIGMTGEVLAKARDAFFSTKPSSEGTGLGLSIVNEIVAKHKGQLQIESKQDEYTQVTVCLPLDVSLVPSS